MQKLSILLIFLLAFNLSAQEVSQSKTDSLTLEIQKCKDVAKRVSDENVQQQEVIKTLNARLSEISAKVSALQTELRQNQSAISQTEQTLGNKIAETEQSANTQFTVVETRRAASLRYGIICDILLLFLSVVLFIWLYRWQKTSRADIIGQLEKTKLSIDEKLVSEFTKQTNTLQSIVEMQDTTSLQNPVQPTELDHSLALKLADEITLMERNISHMNQDTKGLKPLIRAIDRLKDNLASNGYEIPNLLGKPYNEGMKVQVITSIPDENLEKDTAIITKVIKPQVNFNEKMIQMAQIEVSVR